MSRKATIVISIAIVAIVIAVIALWQWQKGQSAPITTQVPGDQTGVPTGAPTRPVAPVAAYADALSGIKSFYDVSLVRLGPSDEERLRSKEGWVVLLQTVRQQLGMLVVPKIEAEEQLDRLSALGQYLEAVRRGELQAVVKNRQTFEQSLK